jgi:DNA polymerase III gamma and tau subunits C terminal.
MSIAGGGGAAFGGAAPAHAPVASTSPAPVAVIDEQVRLRRFEDIIAYAGEQREIRLKVALENDVHLVHFEEGRIEFRLAEGGSQTLANDLSRALHDWTGKRWLVALSSEQGADTARYVREKQAQERRVSVTAHPLVSAVMSQFPGAEIVDVRDRMAEIDMPPPPEADPDEPADDDPGD